MIKSTGTKRPADLTKGDVIVTYPDTYHRDRLGEPGRWTVVHDADATNAGKVVVDYRDQDGLEGVFALDPNIKVIVEKASAKAKAEAV